MNDHETTTPEAAAQHEANRTPYYDERADRYEPDLGPSSFNDSRTLAQIVADIEAVMSR